MTSKIALKTLFDLDDLSDRQQFSGTLKLAFDLMNARLRRIFKLPLWVPTPANLHLQRAVAELDRTVQGFIASGRSRQRRGDDLLSRLLLAQHEDGTRMSDRQLRDEAMTLYLAGHETTALTLAWSWYLLSQTPACSTESGSERADASSKRASGRSSRARRDKASSPRREAVGHSSACHLHVEQPAAGKVGHRHVSPGPPRGNEAFHRSV